MTKAAAWLEEKFVEWRRTQTGRRASIINFAQSAGISDDDFHNVMKGRGLPAEKVARLAKALNDDSAFDAFGIPKPDPIRWAFEKILEALSPDDREAWLREGEKLVEKGQRSGERKAKAAKHP